MRFTKPAPNNRELTATLVIILILTGSAWAQRERALPFNGHDGAYPQGGLVVDAQGNFYGTTTLGGSSNVGVVYEVTPAADGKAVETVLYNFTGIDGDGANPTGDVIFDGSGNLYGVTEKGGSFNAGTVFELSPPASPGGMWSEGVLYSFQGGASDGADPMAGLIFDGGGNLFGTTAGGGVAICSGGCGTVFELMPQPGGSWTESVLYLFQTALDGSNPMAPVVLDQAGNLYGTTPVAGLYNGGTIFELTPPSAPGGAWTQSTLHSFYGPQGINPIGGLTFGPDGALFGTASNGGALSGGTVFRLKPRSGQSGWTYSVAHNFNGVDGDEPLAGVTFGGPDTLYGTTLAGGIVGGGNVFQLSYSGGTVTETVLYAFGRGSDGGRPMAGITLYKGALYGTTYEGGYKNIGVVYRLSRNLDSRQMLVVLGN